jgi:hypothetical protein
MEENKKVQGSSTGEKSRTVLQMQHFGDYNLCFIHILWYISAAWDFYQGYVVVKLLHCAYCAVYQFDEHVSLVSEYQFTDC